jgi:3-hydroxyisobutyrate dehydrogenase
MTQAIGFVGVGRMGANMARRLKDCGYPIAAVYDVNRELARQVAEELGAAACDPLADVTRRADVIFTVVSDDAAMRAIYEAPDDNLLMGCAGKLFINCATITPAVHIAVMRRAAELGAKMLETPMASSIPQAREGKLYLMCAGDPAVFEEARPLLEDLSVSLIYTGAPGTAASLKALVNMVMNINTAALAEGLGLAESLGLDLNLVRRVFSQTGANSRVLETDGEDMQNRDHDTYFSAAHAAKDSGIALALGQEQGLAMPLAAATKAQYDEMVRRGLGDLDKSGISELTFKSRHGSEKAPVSSR